MLKKPRLMSQVPCAPRSQFLTFVQLRFLKTTDLLNMPELHQRCRQELIKTGETGSL